jgi:hypothetical protein
MPFAGISGFLALLAFLVGLGIGYKNKLKWLSRRDCLRAGDQSGSWAGEKAWLIWD